MIAVLVRIEVGDSGLNNTGSASCHQIQDAKKNQKQLTVRI
jgi:hypothetical protein